MLQTHAFWHHDGIVHAPALYKKFRDNKLFSGSELNVEGAAVLQATKNGGLFPILPLGLWIYVVISSSSVGPIFSARKRSSTW